MKRGTPEHPKTYTLAALLNIERWGAVGIVESLWHFAQKYAPAGDVGKHTDEAIARGIGWAGNASTLVSALAAAGWLDRCQCHRLRVHDWPEHCDQTTKRAVKSGFLSCYETLADAGQKLAAVAVPQPSLATAEPKPEPPNPPRGGVVQVFDHWRAVMGHPDAQLLPKRERCVRAMLKRYTVEQLKAAIDGCKATPFNMGQNDRGEVYDDLALICRDGEHVERFMRTAANGEAMVRAHAPPAGVKPTSGERTSEAIRRFSGGGR